MEKDDLIKDDNIKTIFDVIYSVEKNEENQSLNNTTINILFDNLKIKFKSYSEDEIDNIITLCVETSIKTGIPTIVKLSKYLNLIFDSAKFIISRQIIQKNYEIGLKIIEPMELAIIIIGQTGSGKSTLINYLLGNKLKIIELESEDGFKIDLESNDEDNQSSIAHHSKSKTEFPKIIKKSNIFYIDMPGFRDTRYFENEILNSLTIKSVFGMVKKVKIIYVLSFKDITSDRAVSLIENIKDLSLLVDDFEKFKNAFTFVITKSPPIKKYSTDKFRSKIKTIIDNKTGGEDLNISSKQKIIFNHLASKESKICHFFEPDAKDDELKDHDLKKNIEDSEEIEFIPNILTSDSCNKFLDSLIENFNNRYKPKQTFLDVLKNYIENSCLLENINLLNSCSNIQNFPDLLIISKSLNLKEKELKEFEKLVNNINFLTKITSDYSTTLIEIRSEILLLITDKIQKEVKIQTGKKIVYDKNLVKECIDSCLREHNNYLGTIKDYNNSSNDYLKILCIWPEDYLDFSLEAFETIYSSFKEIKEASIYSKYLYALLVYYKFVCQAICETEGEDDSKVHEIKYKKLEDISKDIVNNLFIPKKNQVIDFFNGHAKEINDGIFYEYLKQTNSNNDSKKFLEFISDKINQPKEFLKYFCASSKFFDLFIENEKLLENKVNKDTLIEIFTKNEFDLKNVKYSSCHMLSKSVNKLIKLIKIFPNKVHKKMIIFSLDSNNETTLHWVVKYNKESIALMLSCIYSDIYNSDDTEYPEIFKKCNIYGNDLVRTMLIYNSECLYVLLDDKKAIQNVQAVATFILGMYSSCVLSAATLTEVIVAGSIASTGVGLIIVSSASLLSFSIIGIKKLYDKYYIPKPPELDFLKIMSSNETNIKEPLTLLEFASLQENKIGFYILLSSRALYSKKEEIYDMIFLKHQKYSLLHLVIDNSDIAGLLLILQILKKQDKDNIYQILSKVNNEKKTAIYYSLKKDRMIDIIIDSNIVSKLSNIDLFALLEKQDVYDLNILHSVASLKIKDEEKSTLYKILNIVISKLSDSNITKLLSAKSSKLKKTALHIAGETDIKNLNVFLKCKHFNDLTGLSWENIIEIFYVKDENDETFIHSTLKKEPSNILAIAKSYPFKKLGKNAIKKILMTYRNINGKNILDELCIMKDNSIFKDLIDVIKEYDDSQIYLSYCSEYLRKNDPTSAKLKVLN